MDPRSEPPNLEAIKGLGVGALVERFAGGVMHLERRLLEAEDEQLDTAFRGESGVGRWPCRVLVGHLADSEMVLVHRMRRIVAEESPVLAVWDEHGFIDGGVYEGREGAGPPAVAGFVAVVHTLRKWTAEWLGGLPGAAWSRRGLHPERGEVRLRDVVDYDTWHLEHHAWYLSRKLEVLLGPAGEG